MCGRFCLETPGDGLTSRLKPWLDQDDHAWLHHYSPRALIRPMEPVLVLRHEHGRNGLTHMLWGLLPGWVKNPEQRARPINARAETVAEKASFRGSWRHHRCLLPSSAFFEKGHRISRADGRMFWLAGLWDRWIGADGSEVDTCCVITTHPNALLRPLHNRMPVIIPEGLEDAWLLPGDGNHRRALEPMLEPWPCEGWIAKTIQPSISSGDNQQLSIL